MSCLFQSAEEPDRSHQALEIKIPTSCHVWRLNEKSHISIQDSYFVVEKEFVKERVKNDHIV